MNYYGVKTINSEIHTDVLNFIDQSEERYSNMIMRSAQEILERGKSHPIILLSGPSGSGKTTTALRIEALLDGWGHETHTVSMDNYFDRPEGWEAPLDENGNIDFESPKCLDIPLLADQLEKIANCEPVEIPSFDFSSQKRTEKTRRLQRKPGELVIVEGIHSLNGDVTGRAHDYSTGIYVSVRTRVISNGGITLHPERIRLMRRLIRDNKYRGMSYEETMRRMASVNRGETLYIMPYKNRAEIQIDTFLPYELSVYKTLAEQKLDGVDPAVLHETGNDDLVAVLRELETVPIDPVPRRSLVREFIGGSDFKY